eukprot:82113_1
MFDEWTNATYPISPSFIPMQMFIHVGSEWGNANYEPDTGYMNFGDGDFEWFPSTVLDIIAHEIAHGYTAQGSDLIYSSESGGMNEAFSDLAGEAAEYWLYGTTDWKCGADVVKNGDALRYMYDPTLDGVSIDHYRNYYGQNVHYTSGLYNKATCNLHAIGNWTMEQIFRVFAWANLFYWTPDSTFNEGISGIHRALYDLYDDNITDVETMSEDLEYVFLDVGLARANTTVHDSTLCGPNRFCYYENISVSDGAVTNHTVHIQANDDDAMTYFDIYFTVNDNDCIRPTLSFKYELIDYDSSSEYIEVYDNDGIIINQCQNGQSCGVFDSSCISNYDLGVNSIQKGETYKISVIESSEVDALCNSGQTINAFVTLQCTPHIPEVKIDCGLNTFCYIVDVYPSLTEEVETMVEIQNPDDNSDTYFNVFFIIHENDCVFPQISFEHELIDYDVAEEYIDVFDNEDNLISRCQGGYSCNQFETCISDYDLGVNKIRADKEHYQIKIIESYSVDSQCYQYHNNSINAKLTFTCGVGKKEKFSCGTNRYCYTIPIYPSDEEDTEFSVNITDSMYYNNYMDTYFDVYFVPREDDCVDPSISFIFEETYFGGYDDYLELFDNKGALIGHCTGTESANCGKYIQCLKDYDLYIDTIPIGESFKISITQPWVTYPYCFFSINAKLTIKCSQDDLFDFSTTMDIFNMSATPQPQFCQSIKGTISCDGSVSDSIGEDENHCYEFSPNQLSTVTFSDCKSNFDTTLFVYNDNNEWISEQICDGDDCG